jgi:ATP-dependent Clp protease ATP-binding subunit ClpA
VLAPCGNAESVVFERFTERARQTIGFAQDEARALDHDYIGTEHILLGLLREQEGVAARILSSLEIAIDDVRVQVARIAGTGRGVSPGRLPFTPRSKRVLELALREALSHGHDHIGTEHILLGLLREEDGLAARTLASLGIRVAAVRTQVARIVGEGDDVTLGQIPSTRRVRRCFDLAQREARSRGRLCRHRTHPARTRTRARGSRVAHLAGRRRRRRGDPRHACPPALGPRPRPRLTTGTRPHRASADLRPRLPATVRIKSGKCRSVRLLVVPPDQFGARVGSSDPERAVTGQELNT